MSSNSAAIEAAGQRQVCLLALDVAEAEPDAENIRTGNEVMREAAAQRLPEECGSSNSRREVKDCPDSLIRRKPSGKRR